MKSIFYVFLVFSLFLNGKTNAQTKQISFGFMYTIRENEGQKKMEILEVIDGSDTQKMGLKSGDFISEINAKKITDLSKTEVDKEVATSKIANKMTLKRIADGKEITIKMFEFDRFVCLSKSCDNPNSFSKIKDRLTFYEYEGYIKNNQFEGFGMLKFTGVSKNHPTNLILSQQGQFASGKFLRGTTIYKHLRFEGRLANGIPDGQGYMTLNDGTAQDGEFKNGVLQYGRIVTTVMGTLFENEVKDAKKLPAYSKEGLEKKRQEYVAFSEKLYQLMHSSKSKFQDLLVNATKISTKNSGLETFKINYITNKFSEFTIEKSITEETKLIAVKRLSESDAKSFYQKLFFDINTFYLINSQEFELKKDESHRWYSYEIRSRNKQFGNIAIKLESVGIDLDAPVGSSSMCDVFFSIEKK